MIVTQIRQFIKKDYLESTVDFKGTTEAKNNTMNEFIYCYQLITYLGHRKASKNQVAFCCGGGGCMVAPLSSRHIYDSIEICYFTYFVQ